MQFSLSTIFLVFFFVAASLASFGVSGVMIAMIWGIAIIGFNKVAHKSVGLIYLVIIIGFGIWVTPYLSQKSTQIIEAAHRGTCHNNLSKIGSALLNYEKIHGHFPPVIRYDKNGKPLYSWMVEILPQLGYQEIFDRLHQEEPWNSPHNVRIIGGLRIPEFFCPSAIHNENDLSSNYVAIIGSGTIWREKEPLKIQDLSNAPACTVMVTECVNSGKHWAEPYRLTTEEVLQRMKSGEGMRICSSHNTGLENPAINGQYLAAIGILFADGNMEPAYSDLPISDWSDILSGKINNWNDLQYVCQMAHTETEVLYPVNIFVQNAPTKMNRWLNALSFCVWGISVLMLFSRAWKSRACPRPASSNNPHGEESNATKQTDKKIDKFFSP